MTASLLSQNSPLSREATPANYKHFDPDAQELPMPYEDRRAGTAHPCREASLPVSTTTSRRTDGRTARGLQTRV
jgi:hypothetical protein